MVDREQPAEGDARSEKIRLPVDFRNRLHSLSEADLLSQLPMLIRALPSAARSRCVEAARSALQAELEESDCKLGDVDTTTLTLWRQALFPSESSAGAKVQKPLGAQQAMARPFTSSVQPSKAASDGKTPEHAALPGSSDSVFVTNLPFTADKEQVSSFFIEHLGDGAVRDIRLIVNLSGRSKGTAVVVLSDAELVAKAIKLTGELLGDREITVKEDQKAGKGRNKGKASKGKDEKPKASSEADSRSVIVKNLAFNAKEANIGGLFAGCGEIVAVRMAKDSRTGRSRGFAVVEFSETSAVAKALGCTNQELRGRSVRVEAMGKTPDEEDADMQPDMATSLSNSTPVAEEQEKTEDSACADQQRQAASETQSEDAGLSNVKQALLDHANKLLADKLSSADTEPPKKKRRGLGASDSDALAGDLPKGEEGLRAAAALAEQHLASAAGAEAQAAESLLQAESADGLKSRLAALGLKAGGAPKDRALRVLRLKGLQTLAEVPKELFAGKAAQSVKPSAAAEEQAPPAEAASVKLGDCRRGSPRCSSCSSYTWQSCGGGFLSTGFCEICL
eukprot:TRINITY_DN26692_c0_g1_i1.p1 TRINITY_DN26692_c0_g1~~TRINITY_DN26692_c0_g1_i1.p1  ORF type:complete len:565 (+),score=141.06 TRINITY_DN26692_c0_g1_i1:36-1730(+)